MATILITCPNGLSHVLRKEVEGLSFGITGHYQTGVRTCGSLHDCMLMNLSLSTAHHVLYQVLSCSIRTTDELYKAVSSLDWENCVPLTSTLCVTSNVKTGAIRDTRFANLKCKDAIVDRLNEKTGRRCNSGPERDGVVIHLYWHEEKCMLYIDTSGDSLSRRGYRTNPGSAPMQETLAAGVVRSTSWNGVSPFVNPMCGSGTLAIEAALLACNRRVGLCRENFGFMHVLPFDCDEYRAMRENLLSSVKSRTGAKILATDVNAESVASAREHSRRAGVENAIEYSTCEFEKTPVPSSKGVIIVNPEYGFRMGDPIKLVSVYKAIGDFFKKQCAGYTGYIFTGNTDLMKKFGLKAKRRIPFFSGKLSCRLYEYDLYTGSRGS
jgi:putative N6-adenine-specific DNA methylase